MVSDIKHTYIQRIVARNTTAPTGCSLSSKYITKLAETLSDGTIFGIITELRDIQYIKLNNLKTERGNLVKSYQDKQEKQGKAQGEAYEKMLSDENFLPSHEETMLKHFKRDSADLKEEEREALRLFDLNVLEQLDQQVKDQQSYLEKAGIPGMEKTTDMHAIKKQMFVLSIVESLPLCTD